MWLVLVREVCSILIVTMPKMTVKFQEFLKNQIEVYIRKYPDCRVSDVREFILEGDQGVFDLALFPYKQQWNFINAQMKKFRETGSMKKRKGQGKKPLPQEKVDQIIQKSVHKKFDGSSRTVAAEVGVSPSTVLRKLHANGYKSFPARATQGKNK